MSERLNQPQQTPEQLAMSHPAESGFAKMMQDSERDINKFHEQAAELRSEEINSELLDKAREEFTKQHEAETAQMSELIYGKPGKDVVNHATGEVLEVLEAPTRGHLDELRSNPHYGKTPAERDEFAKLYQNDLESLVSKGHTLAEAHTIVEGRLADEEGATKMAADIMNGEHISFDEAKKKADKLYARKGERRERELREKNPYFVDANDKPGALKWAREYMANQPLTPEPTPEPAPEPAPGSEDDTAPLPIINETHENGTPRRFRRTRGAWQRARARLANGASKLRHPRDLARSGWERFQQGGSYEEVEERRRAAAEAAGAVATDNAVGSETSPSETVVTLDELLGGAPTPVGTEAAARRAAAEAAARNEDEAA